MNDTKFKCGDVVRLISGGPLMTVNAFGGHPDGLVVGCDWFAGDQLRRDAFDAANLVQVEGKTDGRG